jgi:CHAD domain-containing protein
VFVQTEGAGALPADATTPHRVRDTAASRAWAAYERVRAYEPVLRWADVETLHDLRIAAKWLRYTLEFVRETLGPDVAFLVPRIVVLQDHLGQLNDADVAASMARTFLVEHGADLRPASAAVIGQYLASREREVARLRRSVEVPWRGIAGVTFRRRLGRALAGL